MHQGSSRSLAGGQRYPELRRWPRYPISAPSLAAVLPGERRIGGGISVISRGGCYFRAPELLSTGSVLRLRVEWRGKSLETWARVAHSVPGDGMGLAFLSMEPSQTRTLKEWLQELSEKGTQSRQEAEEIAERAGFQRERDEKPSRAVFALNDRILVIEDDGSWAHYTQVSDGRRLDSTGADSKSLEAYLGRKS
jgi:hypothetical protein